MITAALVLIVINFLVSWKGFNSPSFNERYAFHIDRILLHKEYYRIITSGFLHVSWTHLIWNMISLYAFSASVESFFGALPFLIIYFSSLAGGSLFSLLIHRNHANYSAVGASGAVCGVIFASIAVFPGMSIGFFFIPVGIPGWIYGIIFVLYSIYGIRSNSSNVGHDAHLGGALIGMLIAIALYPASLSENYPAILAIALPCIFFIYMIVTRPHILLVDNNFFKTHQRYYSVDHRYNQEKMSRQQEVDRLLDKISRKGIKSLTQKEKDLLQQHSKNIR
jgi:membrane associated rhomboid family serine protease